MRAKSLAGLRIGSQTAGRRSLFHWENGTKSRHTRKVTPWRKAILVPIRCRCN